MNITIFDPVEQIAQDVLAVDAASIYRAFEQVRDGRKAKGKRYPLALLFTLILLGKMAGETTLEGIVDWIHERRREIKSLLHWPKRFPVLKTYIDALARCDHREVTKAITQALLKAKAVQRCGTEPSRLVAYKELNEDQLLHTAVDGKLLRGTLGRERADQPPVHLLSFYECQSGLVLDQFLVPKEKNEESACRAIVHPVLVKGRIVSVDAIFTCKAWCACVHGYEGYYLLTIKENTPAVLRDLQDFFQDEGIDRREFQYQKETTKGHGRIEVREMWTSTQMNEWFQKEWAGVAQVYMLRKRVKEQGKETVKVSYGMTNVPRSKADAKRILAVKRNHWHIENRLHYRRDVTMGEDAAQIRRKGVPEVLAALNGGLLAVFDFMGVNNVAKQMRRFCAHPHKALQWLLGDLSGAKRVH